MPLQADPAGLVNMASFATSVASVVLAIVAIWLSVVFYRMSNGLSKSTDEAAKGIGASVERLEKIFDKLYADTFSMMRDTVSDMRKHMWPEEDSGESSIAAEADERADVKIETLKASIEKDLSQLLERQRATDGNIATLSNQLKSLINKAITSSRTLETEAREEAVRDTILHTFARLQRRNREIRAGQIVDMLQADFPFHKIVSELYKMRQERLVKWVGDLQSDTIIERERSRSPDRDHPGVAADE